MTALLVVAFIVLIGPLALVWGGFPAAKHRGTAGRSIGRPGADGRPAPLRDRSRARSPFCLTRDEPSLSRSTPSGRRHGLGHGRHED
jgi:hypothetical protein